MENINRVDKEN